MSRGLGSAIAVWLAVWCVAADAPDAENLEGQKILSVRFEPAAQPLNTEYVSKIVPLRPGAPLSMTDVDAAILKLYATGRYADVAIEGEPEPGGVALIVRTTDQWFVGRVEATGKVKQPPNRGQLANATRLQLGQPFFEDQLKTAEEGVLNLLRENGFHEARVSHQMTRDPAHQQVNLVFDVNTGKRAKYNTPIVTGNPILGTDDVIKATKWKKWFGLRWKQVTLDNTETGLQNIRKAYEKKNRLAAEVNLKSMQYDSKSRRVTPTLEVNGGPKVGLHTTGAKVSQKKLREYVPIWDEETVDRDLLTEGARNLRDYFQNQGYFDVEVDFQRNRVSPDHEDIVYVINLGRRQKVVKVEVQGNQYFSADTIRERMFVQPAGLIRLRHGRYSRGFVNRDEGAIKALYQSNGFRDVAVNTRTIDDYNGKRNEIAVVMHIDEGPQYFVTGFTLNGVNQIDRQTITSMLSSVPGQPFSEYNVGLDRNYIMRTYNAEGFQDAAFQYQMTPGAKPNTFSVTYNVTEGERRYVRDLLIAGLKETRMRLVKPTIRLGAGDPLSVRAMADMQHNLYDLGVFDKVDMAVQNPDGETPNKYVLYQIVEGHRYQVAGGFGAEIAKIGGASNSWNSPGGATGFSPRVSIDATRYNMFGLGHSLEFKGGLSSLRQTASLNYLAPRFRNVDGRNILFTALYDKSRDVRTFTARKLEGSAQLSQKLSKPTTVFWRLTYRDVTVDKSTLKIQPLLIPLLSQPVKLGLFDANLVNDRRDDPTDAHRGIYTSIDAGIASNIFGGTARFGKLMAINSTYHAFRRNWILARRLEFGLLSPFSVASGVDPTQAVPLPERYFSGGSTSHRGFPTNQAGPRDPFSGFPLGGNAVLIHNTELRFPFLGENIDGVLFHDMGNVYSSLSDISFRAHQPSLTNFNYMVHAAGFGIRYRTPVGPIRVDLAYSINPPRLFGFKGTAQEVLLGTAPRVMQNVSHFQFFFSIGQAF